jgi:hypothetical protein
MSKAGVTAAVAVAACGTATLASGCGGSSASAAPCRPATSRTGTLAAGAPRRLSVVGRAAVKTQKAGTARVAMHASGAESDEVRFTGMIDFRSGNGTLSLSSSVQPDLSGEIRVVGHCEYIQLPGLGSGKPWVSVDVDKLAPGFGANASAPSDSLRELESQGSFHRVGSEHIRGVATTHYRGVLDLARTSNRLPKRLEDAVKKLHSTKMPTNAWIDRSGFLRKMTTSVSGVVVTMEYYDFGVKVNVKAPPPAQVQDVTDKFKSYLGG